MKTKLYILILSVFTLAMPLSEYAQTIANITADSAHTLTQIYAQDPNFVILDVRTPGEYNAGHLDKGVNLDFYGVNFGKILDSIDKNKIYLIHCASGGRSGKAKDSMANRNFQTVYNMMGGYNKWVKTYPVTLLTSPLLAIYDSNHFDLGYIPVGQTKTITIKITNGANDTLKFSSFSGPANTSFSTNLTTTPQLLGYDDYKFQVTYSPTNLNTDTSSITLFSNGGNLKLFLRAQGISIGFAETQTKKQFNLYPNPAANYLIIETQDADFKQFKLISSEGKTMKIISVEKGKNRLDISDLSPGLYFITNSKHSTQFIKE